jgi:hypothetical protein
MSPLIRTRKTKVPGIMHGRAWPYISLRSLLSSHFSWWTSSSVSSSLRFKWVLKFFQIKNYNFHFRTRANVNTKTVNSIKTNENALNSHWKHGHNESTYLRIHSNIESGGLWRRNFLNTSSSSLFSWTSSRWRWRYTVWPIYVAMHSNYILHPILLR